MKTKYLVRLAMSISWMRQRVCDCYETDDALNEVMSELDDLKALINRIAEEEDEQRADYQRTNLVDD